MQILTGDNISKSVDYSFGDHFSLWDHTLPGAFTKYANANNQEFLDKAKEFQGKVMSLYIDNLRLYPRPVKTDTEYDTKFVKFLMETNNLLALCSLLPGNGFIIYTGQEDTPLSEPFQLPMNVLHVYGVNALYNDEFITPFPFGLQRQMNPDDHRLQIMKEMVEKDEKLEPTKLLYINMGIGRNPEREVFKKFETNDWVTTRFDEQSKFFPYNKYQDFLNELRDHKFVACPPGHGMDTHRIWETLYMRRVPIIKRDVNGTRFFWKLLKDFPVLFVDEWEEVTEELLRDLPAKYLSAKALEFDMAKLDLDKIMQTNRERFAHLG